MKALVRQRFTAFLVLILLVFPARPAKADSIRTDAVLVVVGLILVTAAVTTAIILSIKHHPSISGCVTDGPDGLQMVSEGDQTTFLLTGDTVGVKAGERVRVSGSKKGKNASGSRHFFVEKLKKDFGPCKVTP